MSYIRIRVDEVKSINVSIRQKSQGLSNVKQGLSSMRYNMDASMLIKRNIGARMNSAYISISKLEVQLNGLEVFMKNSIDKYCAAEDSINRKVLNIGSNAVVSRDVQLASGKLTSSFNNKISVLDQLKVGANAVIQNATDVYSKFKKNIEPGGPWYKEFQIGKAIVGIGVGVATVLGSGILEVFSGGTATPMMVLTTVYGVNQIISNSYALGAAIAGDYTQVDNFNLLRNATSGLGGAIGKTFGYEKEGRAVGAAVYYAGELYTIFGAGVKAGKEILENVGQINKAGLIGEVKSLPNNIASTYRNTSYKLRDVKVIEPIKQLATNTLKDIKNIKNIKSISDVTAIKSVKDCSNTVKKVVKIVKKPIKRIVRDNHNIKLAHGAYKGIKEVKKSIDDTIKNIKEDNEKVKEALT